ncbi:MAG: PEP-CTERM sorting domain-containing protein [Candidatus Aminicenantes bacterium]|nr:PEP-CTERM sorting domain-containing protein [Candidatus Aminicenantes bacterium]NIQ70036.1 PEP-CTERM sorting domain-containing protein [Candidatus Aminicenantes bacterium]
MKFLSWRKCVLLLLTTFLIALFAVSLHLAICMAVPFKGTFEHRGGKPVPAGCGLVPAAGDTLRFIGDRVFKTLHTGDQLSSFDKKIKESLEGTFAIDFIQKVPDPSTLLIVGSGMIGFALFARKIFRK